MSWSTVVLLCVSAGVYRSFLPAISEPIRTSQCKERLVEDDWSRKWHVKPRADCRTCYKYANMTSAAVFATK